MTARPELTNFDRAILRDVVLAADHHYWLRRAAELERVGLANEALACRRRASMTEVSASVWAETFEDALGDTTWTQDLADRRTARTVRLNLAGPGRCPECEFHVPTQGHGAGCPNARTAAA